MVKLGAAFAAVVFSCLPAFADITGPPPVGWYGSFSMPAIVCDTSDQVKAIVDAATAKPDGGAQAKLDEYQAILNQKGDPTCMIILALNVAVGESIDLGKFSASAKKTFHSWAVHIGNSNAEAWLLLLLMPEDGPALFREPMLLPHGLRVL